MVPAVRAEPVVRLLRVEHCPWRHDFGLRYLREDLPADVADQVEELVPGNTSASLEELSLRCFGWMDELLAADARDSRCSDDWAITAESPQASDGSVPARVTAEALGGVRAAGPRWRSTTNQKIPKPSRNNGKCAIAESTISTARTTRSGAGTPRRNGRMPAFQ